MVENAEKKVISCKSFEYLIFNRFISKTKLMEILMSLKLFIIRVFIFVTIFSISLSAQTETAKEVKKEQVITPILVPNIAKRTEETLQVLSKIKENAAQNSEVDKVKSDYDKLKIQLEKFRTENMNLNKETATSSNLTDIERHLQSFSSSIESIQEVLKGRIEKLNSGQILINEKETEWRETLKSRNKQKIPQTLITRINSTLQTTRKIKNFIDKEVEKLLNLQNTISKDDIYIKEQIIAINVALNEIKKKTFKINNPPLWEIKVDSTMFSDINSVWTQKKETLIHYFNDYFTNFLIHLFFFLFFFSILFYFNYRVKKSGINTDELKFTILILSRPVSTALLISLVITPIIHPHAPSVIADFNRLLIIIPLTRLLPILFNKKIRNSAISMITIFLLYGFDAFFISDIPLQRFTITILMILIISGLFFINKKRLITSNLPGHNKWIIILRFTFWVVILLIIAALFANIVGAVVFAKLLLNGVLISAYLGIILIIIDIIMINLGGLLLSSKLLLSLKLINKNIEIIKRRFSGVIHFIFIILWFVGTLKLFGILTWLIEILTIGLTATASIGKINISLGAVLAFILTIYLTYSISRLIRSILEEEILTRVSLPKGMPATISTMTHYLILGLGFLIAMTAAGMNWSNLALIIGALGVGIGFGLQNLVNNFVSGLILIFERPISIGDVVEVGTLMGTVKRIGIRSSTIRTFNESEVIVPNGLLISQELINWTLSDRQRRLDIPVGVAYGTDLEKVINILQEVAEAHPKVKDYPKPFITFEGFGDSSLDFLLRIWAADFSEGLKIKTEVSINIYRAFAEKGIQIPFPQHDIHIIPQVKKSLEKEDSKEEKNKEEKNLRNNIDENLIEEGGLSKE